MTQFQESVRAVVASIPRGSVYSYALVAQKAGYPKSARAVGSVMKKNFDLKIPCHRVIRSDGYIGEYNRGGARKKAALLRAEGVDVRQVGNAVFRVANVCGSVQHE